MKSAFVYLLKIQENGIYKIGVSKNVEKRVKQLQTGNTEQIYLVNKFHSNYPYKIESYLHNIYKSNTISGEWFYLSDDDVNSFIDNCKKCETNFKCMDENNNPFL